MSTTTLVTSFSKLNKYPEYILVSAPDCCGTVSLLLDDNFNSQMCYELPAINIDIYVELNGRLSLYKERALILHTDINKPNKTYMLLDIPQNCYFAITPLFDNNALRSHNEMVSVFNSNTKWKTSPGNISKEEYEANDGYIYSINEDEYWDTDNTEFNITMIFDNDNIKAGGGGGSSPTPPTPSDLPPKLYYGVDADSTVDTLVGFNEMDITQDTFKITYTNIDNEYQVIAYEKGYNDITSIKTDVGGIELIGTFLVSDLIYNGKNYRVLVSENSVTFDTCSYIIEF
jgi:hypothetical protein